MNGSQQKKEKILILDGNALIHRSFHALPPTMTTKDGKMVNAVYGFSAVLIKALREFKPDYLAVTFDSEGPTFRHKKFEEYKAQREKAPDDLYAQIPVIKNMVSAFGLPVYEKKDFEADDLIGTMVKKVNHGVEKIIVTGDQDTLQLVDKNTQVYTMSRGISESVLYDVSSVKEKFGLPPDLIIDFKALRGDPSDNIPGVPGVGEKTASELLQKFGSLDKIYKHLKENPETSQIKPRIVQLLQKNKEQAYLSRDLATIKTDVDFDFSLKENSFENFDKKKIVKTFQDLEFKSLLPRLNDLGIEIENDSEKENKFERNQKKFNYHLINSDKDFKDFLEKLKKQKAFTFDTETTFADTIQSRLLGISFSWKKGEAYYLNFADKKTKSGRDTGKKDLFTYQERREPEEKDFHPWLKSLAEIFVNPEIKKRAHNLKFDIRVMGNLGIEVKGGDFDTMVASYLVNPSSRQHNLDTVVFTELGFDKISKKDLLGEGKKKIKFGEAETEKLSCYSCEDADFTNRLVPVLERQLKEHGVYELFKEVETPLIKVLAKMEDNGVKIDSEMLKELEKEVSKKIENLEKKIWKQAGKNFNVNSPQQLKEVLFEKLNISTENISKTKTGYSTAADELEKLRDKHEIIPLIEEHRELSKLLNTYIKTLPQLVAEKTGRLHASFNQTITATGRLSSTDPNLQNIPVRTELGQKIRKSFVSPRGYKLLSLDYSQIELRLAAHMSGDKKLIEAFKNDLDIHAVTAAEINQVSLEEVSKQMRREAKAVNFGILYGQGPYGLSQTADIPYKRAKEFIETYFNVYKEIKEFIDKQIEKAREEGFTETLFGRRRYLPEINSQVPQVKKGAERMAINTPLQGTNADMIKKAMIKIDEIIEKKYKENVKMTIQVHDELLFEVKNDLVETAAREFSQVMKDIIALKVPVLVDAEYGNNWGELKKLKFKE